VKPAASTASSRRPKYASIDRVANLRSSSIAVFCRPLRTYEEL
jgi:hypothetical protein